MKTVCVSFDEIGFACFEKIHELGGDIRALVTLEDDRRASRSGQTPFEDLAGRIGCPLLKCRNINEEAIIEQLREIGPELIFVIGWSQLVKPEFIDLADGRVIGMHPTMLPKHRGRAPLPWAMIHGLGITSVSMFYIAVEADNGELIGQLDIPVYRTDTARTLYDRTLRAHVDLVARYFPLLDRDEAPRIVQDETRASHWEKRTPRDGIIDWCTQAERLYDWIRALGEPYPGAFTFTPRGKLVVWAADLPVALSGHRPGEVVAVDCRGALVQAGQGGLWLTRVQADGDDRSHEGHEVAASGLLQVGDVLG